MKKIDYNLRQTNSFFLRVIMIVLLASISFFNENFFKEKIYVIVISIYILALLFHQILFLTKYRGLVRFILDIIVITVFTYNKDLNNILVFFPFILLIFNTINHSNKKDRFIIFFITLHLSIIIADNFQIKFFHHFLPIILYLFLITYGLRRVFQSLNDEVITLIGDLFVQNIKESSSHKILRKVKKEINESKVSTFFNINAIFLFRVINNNLIILKATEFLKENPIIHEDIVTEILDSENITLDNKRELKINGKSHKNSLWLKNEVYKTKYVFLISSKLPFGTIEKQIVKGLHPVFNQICRVFYLSNSLDKLKKEESKIIKEKVTYVLDAKNALHYVKNKLTPVTLTIGLIDRLYKNEENLNSIQIDYIEKRLKENKSNSYINDVIAKAELLIKGVDNLLYAEDKITSTRFIIDAVRKNWLYHFENLDAIKVFIDTDVLSKIKVSYNNDLFEFIFSDLIENIYKYSDNYKSVEFVSETSNTFSIYFKNKINDFHRRYESIREIAELYNHPDNDEIYSRKTHGLSFVRRLMKRKKIINEIIINKEHELFIFKITFEII